MKNKFILTLSFLLVFYFICSFNLLNINANSINNKKIFVETTDNIDLSNIKFEIYASTEINNNNFSDNSECLIDEVYTNSRGEVNLTSNENISSVIIDLSSIPSGYGVDKKIVLGTDDYVFNIKKIDKVECSADRIGSLNISTYGENFELYTENYDIEIYNYIYNQSDSFQYTVNVITDKEFSFTISVDLSSYTSSDKQKYFENVGYLNENNLMLLNNEEESAIFANHLESFYNNYSLTKTVTNYNIYCDNSNEEFINKNNTLADYVANCFIEAEKFYIDTLGYRMPLGTGLNSSNIYITLFDSATSNVCNGVTNYIKSITVQNGNVGITTYFEIEILNKESYSQEDLNYILSVCIHEYFHGVQASYNITEIWLAESSATYMTLYYMDIYKNIVCNPLEERYAELVNAYLNNKSHLQFVGANGADDSNYGSMIFFPYLYEKFGNINFMKNIVIQSYNSSNRYNIVNILANNLNLTHDELFKEFQLYACFPSYKITTISKRYTNLWQKNLDQINNSNIVLKDNTSNLYKLEADTDLSKIVNTTVTTTNNIYFYLIKKVDNDIVVTNISYEDGFTVKYDGITLNSEDIYILAINANSNLYNVLTFNFLISTSNITAIMQIGYNNKIYDLNDYLNGNLEVIRLHTTISSYYEFEIINILNATNSLLEVYDTDLEILSKVDYDSNNVSKSFGTATKLVSYINCSLDINGQYNRECYLRINRNNLSNLSSTQLKVKDNYSVYDVNTTNFSESNSNKFIFEKNYDNILGDEIYHINNKIIGNLNLVISSNNINEEIIFYIISKVNKNDVNYSNKFILSADNTSYNIDLRCNGNTDITIIYTNCNNVSVSIDCTLTFDTDFTVVLDKNDVNNSLLGSEVRLNNGLKESNTIMVGMTRCAFLGTDVEDDSRLNYNWYSSDESIASISQYGTITAYKPGKVLLQAYSKSLHIYTSFYVIVYADSSNENVQISLTTDSRPSEVVGTEVSSLGGLAGGTTIHIGYTRLISLTSNAPSSIIQDYYWTSSNSNIARISEFGTITGVSQGTVVISCVYKYNSRFVGSIVLEIV